MGLILEGFNLIVKSCLMQKSNNPTYFKMFEIMDRATPPVWASIEEGERRVLQGDYAYLSESSSIEYRVERNCDLMQVGNWLDSKGYGIGLPKGSDVDTVGTSSRSAFSIKSRKLTGKRRAIFH